jgi:hypothetical protein
MPKPLSILVVVGALFALPANAQNTQRTTADQKQCSDQFKAADLTMTAC